jgi:hypothetical protein
MAIWLFAFSSPTVYFLLVLLADRSQFFPHLPAAFVVSLFCFILAAALVVCESIVWTAPITAAPKIGWMAFTLLAILLQFGIIVVIIRAILITAIALAQ